MRFKKSGWTFLIIIILCCFLSSNNVFSKNKYLKRPKRKVKIDYTQPENPAFICLSFNFSGLLNFYSPDPHYFYQVPLTMDFGIGLEYFFYKWFSVEGDISFSLGYTYLQTQYITPPCTYKCQQEFKLEMHHLDFFLRHNFSTKLYLNSKKDPFSFFLRTGLTFEGWIVPYYFFFINNSFVKHGNFYDDEEDLENAMGHLIDYREVYLPFNIGPHIGLGFRYYNEDRSLAYTPEVRATFFWVPTAYGETSGVEGFDDVMIRNDGENDASILDMKIHFQLLYTLSIRVMRLDQYEKKEKMITLIITFAPNSPRLLNSSKQKIDRICWILRKYKDRSITIVGHANHVSDRRQEYLLSLDRAKSVKEYLISKGVIKSGNSRHEGRGSSQMVASNKTPWGRKRNRRVVIIIHGEK